MRRNASHESIATIGIASKLASSYEFVDNNQLYSDGLVWIFFIKLDSEIGVKVARSYHAPNNLAMFRFHGPTLTAES